MALSEATSQRSRTPSGSVDVEQAQAALVEHYPRLVRLAYLVLPTSLARHRRVLTAHSLVQRALPRGREAIEAGPLPAQRAAGGAYAGPSAGARTDGGTAAAADSATATAEETPGEASGAGNDAAAGASSGNAPGSRPGGHGDAAPRGSAYLALMTRVLRAALSGERQRRLGPWRLRPLPVRPGLFPLVLGLRLLPRSGGAYELALEKALSEVSGAARAACALRAWEGMTDDEARRTLEAAGAEDASGALAEAAGIRLPAGGQEPPPIPSEFDPCSLQARPTDLLRRRQHLRAALAAAAAVVVCGALLGLPDGSWGPDGAAAPRYARNLAAERALDPRALTRLPAGAWKHASRTDFSAWPARGDLTGDHALLRRALAVWARPGSKVRVSVTRGTPAGPPSGPPQLLYAGRVDGSRVVLLYDGLRAARYAEPEGADSGGAVLDIARTDGASTAESGALVISRSDSNVRYLTAPWVRKAAEVDLLRREDDGRRLTREDDGVLTSLTGPSTTARACHRWPGLLLTDDEGKRRLYTDLGELTAVRLTGGSPEGKTHDATGPGTRARLARTACGLRSMLGGGVRTVNTWKFATQVLPGGLHSATWTCTRGETWRGTGSRIFTGFRRSGGEGEEQGAQAVFTGRANDTTACGPHRPHVVTGALWKSGGGNWYLLAAGSRDVTSIRVSGAAGGSGGTTLGRRVALPVEKGVKAKVTARLADGERISPPR